MLGFRKRSFTLLNSAILVIVSASIVGVGWKLIATENTSAQPGIAEKKPGSPGAEKRQGDAGRRNAPAIAVTAVHAKASTIKSIQTSIGTVVPAAEVVVHSRVNGQLTKVLFEEGQWVKQGQLLAQIDARSFEADLAQIQGQADRNKALLRNAEQDLERYLSLRTQSAISQQQIDAQKNLVEQYRGTLLADQGALERAKLQLSFTQITAPIEGRIGLRNLDAGNNIATTDPLGLAVITQVQPVNVVFTLPEDNLPELLESLNTAKSAKRGLAVEAWDKSNRQALALGEIISLDNRIDPNTGTVKLKASFANKDSRLFPNQFVNLRVQFGEHAQATIIPATAIQRGSQGTYVYLIKTATPPTEKSADKPADTSVSVRLIKPGASEGNQIAVQEGLDVGDLVVTQGVDKLREGAKVIVSIDKGQEDPASEKIAEEINPANKHQGNKGKQQKI